MDFAPIIHQVFSALWFLVPLAILAAVLKSPWFKGITGEAVINLSAKLFLNAREYRLIRDVTLPTADGTTQIDHVIVSEYGVFVIETKNMKGWIFGQPNQRQWTQKIFKHTNRFQNPLHQNYKHVKALQDLLGLANDQLHSLVVFIGDSEFKTPMPENVTYGGGYIRYIKSKRRLVLSPSLVDAIEQKIASGRLPRSLATRQAHIEQVNAALTEVASAKSCARCGSPMRLRTAKKGANAGSEFWGCSEFPKCRHTEPAEQAGTP